MNQNVTEELVVMLKRENEQFKVNIKALSKENDELKRGETGIEKKIKALNDMNSQKVKALLRSI
jgi:cell division protein FtsB